MVRWAGAAYLVWLGIRTLTGGVSRLGAAVPPAPLVAIFRQGVVTNVLNPKVAMFFLAFLLQFADASRGPLGAQFLALGLLFIANGLVVCVGYAWAASRIGEALRSRDGFARWLHRAMGAVFVGLGVRLALARR